jgi:exonuclease VII large subunit
VLVYPVPVQGEGAGARIAADHRAATPSAAAEAVSPDGQAWLQQLLRVVHCCPVLTVFH